MAAATSSRVSTNESSISKTTPTLPPHLIRSPLPPHDSRLLHTCVCLEIMISSCVRLAVRVDIIASIVDYIVATATESAGICGGDHEENAGLEKSSHKVRTRS